MKLLLLTLCCAVSVNALLQNEESIFFRFYKLEGNNMSFKDYQLNVAQNIFNSTWYNSAKPTVLYIHGFLESTDEENAITVTSALLRGVDFNVIAIDWRELAFHSPSRVLSVPRYPEAVRNTKIVGEASGRVLNAASSRHQLAASQVYIVGFSLGAHTAGYLARNLTAKPSGVIGLDPAGPGFDGTDQTTALTSRDAEVVHIVHTDRGILGTNRSDGHANFFFNNGVRTQPGCGALGLEIGCSHNRSCAYFAEAVSNPTGGVAKRCNNLYSFITGTCDPQNYFFRFPPDTTARGRLYLETNSAPPYLRGLAGVKSEVDYGIGNLFD